MRIRNTECIFIIIELGDYFLIGGSGLQSINLLTAGKSHLLLKALLHGIK